MAATMTQAITELYDGIQGFPPLYLTEVPEDKSLVPSAIIVHQGEVPTYAIRRREPQSIAGLFLIEFYDIDADVAEARALEFKEAAKDATLTIGPDDNVRLYRESYTVEGTKLRDKEGNQVFRATIAYSCKFNFDR